jgi:hypothetical protein
MSVTITKEQKEKNKLRQELIALYSTLSKDVLIQLLNDYRIVAPIDEKEKIDIIRFVISTK